MLITGFAAILVGLRRGGIQGAAILAVALISAAFDSRSATALALVIFLTADIQAVFVFLKNVDWKLLLRLLIPTVVGVAVAAVVGPLLPPEVYEWVLFAIIVISFAGMLYQQNHKIDITSKAAIFPVTIIFGFLSGFTSMIGNLSSIFVAIFFAVVRANKMKFIATTAWFFFILNLTKLSVHIFVWHSLDGNTALIALIFLPLVTLGLFLGKFISGKLKEDQYWNFVVIMVALGIIQYFLSLLFHI